MSSRGQYGQRVPIGVMQAAFETSGCTPYEVANRMGWFYKNTPDSHRVNRVLGLKSYVPGKGRPPRYRDGMSPAMASALLEAMDLIPAEVGL
jgi:hypothetical protein